MTWKNAFDLGSCRVEVYAAAGGSPDYSAILAKGGSANLVFQSTWSMHIAVSASGVVTLDNTSGSGLESDAGVRVLPQYSLASMDGARAVLPVSASGSGDASANGDLLAGFVNGDASVDLTAQTPFSQIAVQTNTIGSSGATPVVQFSPEFSMTDTVTAPDETLEVVQGSPASSITPVITLNGTATPPDSMAIESDPEHGTAVVSGAALLYTPPAGYYGPDAFEYSATINGTQSNIATVNVTVTQKYNCDCDDTTDHRTLKQLRDDLMRRLGFGAQVNNPPPGMADLLNSFLVQAQELLYRRYDVLRTERLYSWPLQVGVRFYDVTANVETCTKRIDPRKVTWVGVVRDGQWYPLVCGIAPSLYSGNPTGWPSRYEIRQCIEVWPAPDATAGSLVMKGHFGLEAFAVDTDKTTIDDALVFALALANAKSHYRQPDANNYIAQMEAMMRNLVAGSHHTRRYVPGDDGRSDYVYVRPKPTEPFPT